MSTSNWDKFKLLSWKNWLIQVRHKKRTFFELLIPCLSVALLLLLRLFLPYGPAVPDQHYDGYAATDMRPFLSLAVSDIEMVLAYSPKNPILEELVASASKLLNGVQGVTSNQTSGDLNKFLAEKDIFCGIEFPDSYKDLTELPEHLDFSLRFPSKLRSSYSPDDDWRLNKKFAVFSLSGPRNPHQPTGGLPPGYLEQGFTPVQSALSEAFIRAKGSIDTSKVYLQRYPLPSFTQDQFWISVDALFPLIIILTLASPAMTLVKYITLEKEQQLKETMKIMGLPSWLHWLSWFTKAFVQFALVITIITAMLKVRPLSL